MMFHPCFEAGDLTLAEARTPSQVRWNSPPLFWLVAIRNSTPYSCAIGAVTKLLVAVMMTHTSPAARWLATIFFPPRSSSAHFDAHEIPMPAIQLLALVARQGLKLERGSVYVQRASLVLFVKCQIFASNSSRSSTPCSIRNCDHSKSLSRLTGYCPDQIKPDHFTLQFQIKKLDPQITQMSTD